MSVADFCMFGDCRDSMRKLIAEGVKVINSDEIETKTCRTCKQDKAKNLFYKNTQSKDGLAGKCADCIKIIRKEWDRKYNSTPKARNTAKRYYYSEKGQSAKTAYREIYEQTPEQKEKYRIAAREHEKEEKYKERRKKYDQSVKGKIAKAERDKRFFKTDKGRFSKNKVAIRRKHQIKATDCSLTRDQWKEIKRRFGYACAYCGKVQKKPEMDHVIPLSKGGPHSAENIVPACRTCNATKGDRLILPVLQASELNNSNFYLQKARTMQQGFALEVV